MSYDVVIVGGGPAGLSAALNLGRARRRVLLCDGGARRNAAAEAIHGFVTRDGAPPDEFRRIGRQQLQPYPSVEVRDVAVQEIGGQRGAFTVRLATGAVEARRILLATGMIDELPELPGFAPLWGHAIVQCPYCHAWEARDQAFGVLASTPHLLEFALLLRAWTSRVVVFTDGKLPVPADVAARLARAGVLVDERPIERLVGREGRLERVELAGGPARPLDLLFARPPQRQVPVVQALGLTLDSAGYLQVDEQRQTSRPGIYAGGDLITPVQSAILAAAAGMQAAAALNFDLVAELATAGALP